MMHGTFGPVNPLYDWHEWAQIVWWTWLVVYSAVRPREQ